MRSPDTALPRRSASASPWLGSAAVHALFGGAALLFAWTGGAPRRPEVVEMQVVEKPAPASRPVDIRKRDDAPRAKLAPKTPPHRVFGISRNAHTAGDSTVAMKPGNTVAKEQDNELLRPGDEDLPAPTDEYLVSQMPVLADEVRIPYPPEARRKGVAGAVVMDILVDDKGNVRDAKLVSGPGSGLDEAALQAVKGFKFKPALVSGKPVTVRIRYAYRFVLER